MEAALIGYQRQLFVYFLLSVLSLSSLRGVRSCGGRLGLGSRLDLLGLFVISFLLLGPFLSKKKITIRDLYAVNRDFFVTIHDKNIANHDMNFSSYSLKN